MINLEYLTTNELKKIGEELNNLAKKEDLEFYRVGFGDLESYLMMIPNSLIKEDTIQEGNLSNPHKIGLELRTYLINKLTVPRYTHTKESQIPPTLKKYPEIHKTLLMGVKLSQNEINIIKLGIIRPFERFEYIKKGENLDISKLPALLMGIPINLKRDHNLD